MQEYANSINRAGAALANCFGFIDVTVRHICLFRLSPKPNLMAQSTSIQ